jgi:hypothetical protein
MWFSRGSLHCAGAMHCPSIDDEDGKLVITKTFLPSPRFASDHIAIGGVFTSKVLPPLVVRVKPPPLTAEQAKKEAEVRKAQREAAKAATMAKKAP